MLVQANHSCLEEEQIGDVTVVKFTQSELLDEGTIQAVSAQLLQLGGHVNPCRLVVNLGAVERLSTGMLGTFVALQRRIRAGGGKLVLCGVTRELRRVFGLMRLSQLLPICAGEQEALQSF